MDKVGLVPAAGYARRLGNLEGSKEMLRVQGELGEKPVCNSLFDQFHDAEISNLVVVTRPDKADFIAHLHELGEYGFDISIVLLQKSDSTLESILSAYDKIKNKEVYLGFPDMILSPRDIMRRLCTSPNSSESDLLLAALPTTRPEKCDMVAFDENGVLQDLQIKRSDSQYDYTWILAKWSPAFTQYIYDSSNLSEQQNEQELYIGDLIKFYSQAGNKVLVERISEGRFIDIGTPDDLVMVQK